MKGSTHSSTFTHKSQVHCTQPCLVTPNMRHSALAWSVRAALGIALTSALAGPVLAEGTKQWSPDAGDYSALGVTETGSSQATTYPFAGFGQPADNRLYIHVADPSTEQIHVGLSNLVDGSGNALTSTYYFRIVAPDGTVVHGPHAVGGATVNLTSHAEAVAGPNTVNASGYSTSGIWTFDPATTGKGAGDYYIEFDTNNNAATLGAVTLINIRWFDFTVATKSSPTAIDGRVWSKNWGVRAANPATYTANPFAESFDGALYAYDSNNFVTKVDFNGSGLRPLQGQFSFNDTGTGTTGTKTTDRKSVMNANQTTPKHKIFLNQPDPTVYPLGTEGQLQNLPLKIADINNTNIQIEVTQPGNAEIVLDINGDGVYTAGTDVRLFASLVAGVNQITWNGKDGAGNKVTKSQYPINTLLSYTQGETHFTAFDVEGLDNGFTVYTQTSAGLTGPNLLFWDDSNITQPSGMATTTLTNTDTGATTRQTWNYVSADQTTGYGNANTINTWWYAFRQYQTTTVVAGNNAPVATDDSASTNEDTPVNGSTVLGNDTDVDGDTLTVNTTPTVAPSNGTVVINANGTYVYTPNANFSGTDTFSYEISDGFGGTDTATVTITINPINDNPVAVDDVGTTTEDTVLNGASLLGNDTDADGNTLVINTTPTVAPTHGTVVINADGTYTYTPNANFSGSDSFTYSISDGNGGTDTAVVTLTITPANDPPVATDDSASTTEDTVLNGTTVLSNDTDVEGNPLTVNTTPTVAPSNGTVVLNANGTYTYTPNANFSGTDSFTYEISDGNGGTDTATVTITVSAVNDNPVATDDTASTNKNTVLNGSTVLANDSDADGDTLTINTTPTAAPTHGTVVINADGTYTYTPTANYVGTDSFTYEISDGKGGTDTATVTITIAATNAAPVATDDTATTNEDTPLNGASLLGNDSDADGDTLTINTTPVTAPTNGTLVINADGTYTYTPNANFSGTDTFTYEVSDGKGGMDTATVTITVSAVNDNPVATDDTATTNEDTPLNGASLLGNDTDADGDTLTINTTPVTAPTNGTLVINADGTYTYTPNANFSGTDTFTYEVSDGKGGTDTATVTITVSAVNDNPVATDDTATTNEDTPLNGASLLGNDTDADGDTLTINTTPVTAPTNGTLAINADGTYTYTPNANFSGTDTFTYEISDGKGGTDTATVTITVSAVNDNPVATDDTATTNEDTPLNGASLLGNDTDADGDTLTINTTPVTAPTNGTLVINADGTYTYTPNANFSGTDTFTYEISDGKGGTDTATVTITVSAVNDNPVANDDTATTNEDTPLNGASLLGNDSDADGDTLTINTTPVTAPTNGTLVINADGTYTYTPNANFSGTDSFTYEVSDGKGGTDTATVTITVTAANDNPVATDDAATTNEDTPLNGASLLGNDSDADGDTLTINTTPVTAPTNGTLVINADGTYTYTPNANFSGTDTFTYEISDGKGGTDTATVTITVSAVNDNPVANNDTATTLEDQPLNGASLLGNDSDADGDTLTINTTPVTAPTNGTLVINADGTYTYTPNANFSGTDTFTYEISDGKGGTDTATVTINVGVQNDAPVATDDTATTNEDQPLNGASLLGNDTDADGDTLTINTTPVTAPSNGTLVINADGTYTYTPNANFSGTDMFTYEVSDGKGGMDTATVTITVSAVNDNPVANDDTATTNEDTPLNGASLLGNDSDADGDTLTINTTPVTAPTNGTLVINADGTYTYTPNANFSGTDSFTYEISDGKGGTDTATVTITVSAVNDNPVATDDAATTNEDTPLNGASLLGNDSDADGDTLTINTTPVTAPTNGTLVINADGTYTYTPNANFSGTDTFTYEISDGKGGTDTATVTITVSAVNDNPVANNDTATVGEDGILAGASLLGNDSDADGDTLTINTTPVTAPTNGTVTINADGTYTYTPNANFSGTDSFTYEISDGKGGKATATVTLTVTATNDLPVATDDTATTNEDTVLIGTAVLINDTDADGDTLTVNTTPTIAPTHGTLALNANGTYTYTPNANFNGTDSFTYEISDGKGGTDTATVTITVTAANDNPIATNDTATTGEDSVLNGANLLGNDSDADGDTLTINTTPVTAPTNGTLVINADGTYTYTPNANFNGTDSFTYEVSDGNGGKTTATVTITVSATNDVPVATDDTATTNEDTPLNGASLLGNDTDADGDTLTINTTPVTAPSNGTLVINADGTYTYTPNANFSGTDTFTYEVSDGNGGKDTAVVTITVTATNDSPVANNDTATVGEDGILAGASLLGNDTDPDGDTLIINTTPVTAPTNGTVTINADGTYTYTPNANFNGTDSFTYEVSDGNGGKTTATVTITVSATNDLPVASDDSFTGTEDTVLNGTTVLVNDSDADGDTLTINTTPVVAPTNGSLVLNADGTFAYTPNANFNGTDSFTYEISDGNGGTDTAIVTLTIAASNDLPVATDDTATVNEDGILNGATLLNNDVDSDGDTLTINTTPVSAPTNGTLVINADGTYTYTPNANFNGTDSFTYEISDGKGGTDTATVTITVTATNDNPVANNDTATIGEDGVLNGANLLGNDSDADGDTLTINTTPVTPPSNGTLVINADGTYTYTPNANFNGTDSFTYEVSDGNGGKTTATVTITVSDSNDIPVAVDDTGTTAEDTTFNGTTVLANDTDADGDTLSVNPVPVVAPTHGTVGLNTDGTYSYTPNANFNGTDTFTYEVLDGNGGSSNAVVTITITPVNDTPVANADTATTLEDQPLTGTTVLANDTDADGDTLTVNTTPVTPPANGTLVLNADGTYTYTPNANFNGTDSFTYEVSDSTGAKHTATVTITVGVDNDVPVATADTATVDEDTELKGTTVLANDTDADGDALTVNTTPIVAPSNGALLLNADGTYTYTPNPNFHGTDTFTYEVTDGKGGMTTATVTITVNSVNDVPVASDDSATTNEDTPLNGSTVLSNDVDDDGDKLTINTTPTVAPTNGTVVINADGTYTYTPNANFHGTDTFTYEVSDGNGGKDSATVTITVNADNDIPVAVDDAATTDEDKPITGASLLGNDTDADGQTLTITTTPVVPPAHGTVVINADGTYTYTPNANFNGTDTFTYEVSDGNGGKDTAVVTLTINAVNDSPVANDDTATVMEDNVLNGTVMSNDSDVDGDKLTVNTTPVVAPTNGTLVLNADGTYTYTPNKDFSGTDTFTYEISDTNGVKDTAVVTITVTPVNDAPLITSDINVTFAENGTGTVLDVQSTDDNDAENKGLTYSLLPFMDGAVFTIDPVTGAITFKAPPDYEAPKDANADNAYLIMTRVCDSGNLCTDQLEVIVVTNVIETRPPVITSTVVNTPENKTFVTTVAATDPDAGDTLTYSITGGADASLFTINPTTGELQFKTAPDFENPTDTDKNNVYDVVVSVWDNTAPDHTDSQALKVTVTDVNENTPPTISSDGAGDTANLSVAEDTSSVTTVQATDAQNDTLIYSISGGDDAALFQIDPTTGKLSFKVAPDYESPTDANQDNQYVITVKAQDPSGASDTQTLTISVTNTADVRLQVRGFLEGAYVSSDGMMQDQLRSLGLLPLAQPYTATPFNYAGTETSNATQLALTGNDAPVDWVLVELRDATQPATRVAAFAGLLQRDGDVADAATGNTLLALDNLKAGSYYVTLRHRNHLAVTTGAAVALSSSTPAMVDFTKTATVTMGTHARLAADDTTSLMWAGDASQSDTVIANGPSNDTNAVLGAVLTAPDNTLANSNFRLNGYAVSDLNMDGITIFAGPSNDINLMLGNVLLHPANVNTAANYIINGSLPK